MAHVLIMPRQGNTVESCIIVEWKKKEGDTVDSETVVCEVETDKATFEVPAGASGTVLKVLHTEGDDVPVLQPIMVVGKPGEKWEDSVKAPPQTEAPKEAQTASEPASAASSAAEKTQAEKTASAAPAAPSAASGAHLAISPRARAAAFKEAVDVRTLSGSGAEGRIIEADVLRAAAERPPLTAAAKEALRSGGSLPAAGSGIGGRVTLADIQAVADGSAAAFAPASGLSAGADRALAACSAADEYTDTPIKGIRKVIAERMMNSLATAAQFTLNASAEAVRMQSLRERFKASDPAMGLSKVTVNDLVLFLVSRLLKEFPFLNGVKTNGTIRLYKNVHLGMAVDTPRGLMVPVIRNADRMSLSQISAQAKQLAADCQAGSISPDLLSGSTFTVTNLGNTGIESFTPVINAPEIAILGVCGIQPKPAADGQGGYAILPHLSFSLTIDHAVVDGAPAAKFVKALCAALKDIDIWIAR